MRTPIALAAAALALGASPAHAQLVAVGDADMAPTAFVNGRLDPRVPGAVDQLLAIAPRTGALHASHVSNAVTGPAASVDKSDDGRYAVVVETSRPAPPGATLMSELPPGHEVSLHALRPGRPPRLLDRTRAPREPASAAISPDGRHVLVTTRDLRRPVVLYELRGGRFGGARTLDLGAIPAGPGVSATWTPDGRGVAVALGESDVVAFYRFREGRLEPAGAPVRLAARVFGGAFTPGGRVYIAHSVPRFAVPEPGTTPDPADYAGTLTVVDALEPHVIQTVPTPIGPEGLALSPDGRRVVTANYQTTPLEPSHPLFSPVASLALWSFDGQRLTKLAEAPFEGILPEGVDFDPSGRRLAVATYQRDWAGLATQGSVDIWRVDAGALTLERRVPTQRGVHSLAWMR